MAFFLFITSICPGWPFAAMGVSGGLGDVRSDLFRPVAKVFFAVDWRNLQGERLIDMPRTEDERGSTLQLWMSGVHLTVCFNRQRAGATELVIVA